MTAPSRAPRYEIWNALAELVEQDQELSRLEADWVDLEFEAIIAANFDTAPPPPADRPTSLPNRWGGRPTAPRPENPGRLQEQKSPRDSHGRQRSPPRRA